MSGQEGGLPYRTNTTDLSDDELVLFDTFWCGSTQVRLLDGEIFREQWNLGYVHSLEVAELRETVRTLSGRGLVRLWREGPSSCRWIGLTKRGGEMWAAERCPVWSCWANDAYPTTRRGRHVVELSASSRDTLQNFIETGTEAGMWDLSGARLRSRRYQDYHIASWGPAAELHVMYAIGVENELPEPDWELYERQRRFWRSVPELQKILRASI